MTDQPKGLDNGLTNYGDLDFARFLRRSFARSMGLSREMLNKPVVGIAMTPSGFNNCHRYMPELVEAVSRGVLAAGALPRAFPDHLARRGVPQPDQHDVPQPHGHGHRGDDRRPAHGCGRADRRLRQDRAGPADGRGLGRAAGHPARDRADVDRPPQGPAAWGLHRLPRLLGQVPRRLGRLRRDRDRGGPPVRDRRHLRGDGHGLDHGLHHRGARHVAARHGRDPGRAFGPAGRGRGDRQGGGAADREPHHPAPGHHARSRSRTPSGC